MPDLVTFIAEIDEAIGSENPARRIAALRRVTLLFLEQANGLSDDHIVLFDDVILHLARNLETRVRAELSRQVAPLAKGPPKTLRHLAHDEAIEVAGPVLEQCPGLSGGELAAIARDCGQDHLLALSRRQRLESDLTDILIARGAGTVCRSLARNGGAAVSADGFSQLIARAGVDEDLQHALQGRADIPPQLLPQLIEVAQERVRRQLSGELGQPAAVAASVERAGRDVEEASAEILSQALGRARHEVERKSSASGLSEDDIVAWLKAGQCDEAFLAIARIAGLPFESVQRALRSTHLDPLLIIVRAARLGWNTFRLALEARHGPAPSESVLRAASDSFQRLSVVTAQRVVSFTAARERALHTDAA